MTLRSWQVAFVIGLVAFLFGSFVVLGSVRFVAVVGVLGIAVTVVSQLLSAPSRHDNLAISTAKRFLNVPPFLKGATLIVWLATISIWSYAAFAGYRAYYERQKVTLEGIVLNANGRPADNATVVLLLKRGYLQTISSNGRFIFEKADLSDENTRSLKVHARLGSKEGEVEIDMSQEVPKNIVIKLSPGDPPFRITYFVLERQAIDFLLQGKMDKQWEARLAGQPFIAPNVVSKTLSSFVKSFSKDLGAETPTFGFYKIERGVKSNSQVTSTGQSTIKSYFVGGSDGAVMDVPLSIPELLNSLTDDQDWKVFLRPTDKPELPYSFVFRKFVTRNDLRFLSHEPVGKFYSYITKERMPQDFGYLEMYFTGACGDGPPWSVQAHYVGRILGLRVAVVENIANEPIRIGKFAFRENDTTTIYTPDENKAQLGKNAVRNDALFPMEMLKPGEKIVIPIEMRLGFDKEEESNDLMIVSNRQDIYDRIRTKGEWYLGDNQTSGSQHVRSISTDALEAIMNRSSQMVSLEKEYLVGPSITVQSLEVDSVEFPFRQFDPSKIVVFDATDNGSCPYVYTNSPVDKTWHNEGVILRGRVGKNGESLDEKVLNRFTGRLLIKEKDREDSFIDSIFVRVTYSDGRESIIYPRNHTVLSSVDGNRIKIRQGQELILDFDIPRRDDVEKYVLNAVGYYVPYGVPGSSPAQFAK